MKEDFQMTPHKTAGVISVVGGGAVQNGGICRAGPAGGTPSGLICYNCLKPGHYTLQCKSPSTRNTDNKGSREMASDNIPIAKSVWVGEMSSNARANHISVCDVETAWSTGLRRLWTKS